MRGFKALFNLGIKKRMRDSFLIGYGVIFPLMLIGILGYMAKNYYSGEISSYYYYTVVTIPFCTFLGAITFIYTAKEEAFNKCGERFIIAPVSKIAIVLSKIIPSTIAISFYNLILLAIAKVLFKLDLQGEFLKISILLIGLGFMSAAVGTFIGFCTKDFMAVKNIVNMPILIMAILGGSFFPIGSLGGVIEKISYISPLTWVNRGLFMMMNDGINTVYIMSLVLVLIIGLIFVGLAVKGFKKEAFI